MSSHISSAIGQTNKPQVSKWIRDSSTIRFWEFPIPISCFDCSPDGRTFVVRQSGFTNIFKIYDLESLQQIGVDMIGNDHEDSVYKLLYSPQGNQIASASRKTLIIWDSGTQQQMFKIIVDHIDTFQFTQFGNKIAIVDQYILQTWDCKKGEQDYEFDFDYFLRTLRYSIDGKSVIFAENQTILIWEIQRSRFVRQLRSNSNVEIDKIENNFNGSLIISEHRDDLIRIWHKQNSKLIRKLNANNDETWDEPYDQQVKLSPVSNKMITTVISGQALLWDLNTAKNRVINSANSTHKMQNLRFSPDGRFIIYFTNLEDNKLAIMRLLNCRFMNRSKMRYMNIKL